MQGIEREKQGKLNLNKLQFQGTINRTHTHLQFRALFLTISCRSATFHIYKITPFTVGHKSKVGKVVDVSWVVGRHLSKKRLHRIKDYACWHLALWKTSLSNLTTSSNALGQSAIPSQTLLSEIMVFISSLHWKPVNKVAMYRTI